MGPCRPPPTHCPRHWAPLPLLLLLLVLGREGGAGAVGVREGVGTRNSGGGNRRRHKRSSSLALKYTRAAAAVAVSEPVTHVPGSSGAAALQCCKQQQGGGACIRGAGVGGQPARGLWNAAQRVARDPPPLARRPTPRPPTLHTLATLQLPPRPRACRGEKSGGGEPRPGGWPVPPPRCLLTPTPRRVQQRVCGQRRKPGQGIERRRRHKDHRQVL